jgi:hypothetical protein
VALAARAGTSRPAAACWGQGQRGGWHLRAAWRAAIGGEPEAELVGRIVWGREREGNKLLIFLIHQLS